MLVGQKAKIKVNKIKINKTTIKRRQKANQNPAKASVKSNAKVKSKSKLPLVKAVTLKAPSKPKGSYDLVGRVLQGKDHKKYLAQVIKWWQAMGISRSAKIKLGVDIKKNFAMELVPLQANRTRLIGFARWRFMLKKYI